MFSLLQSLKNIIGIFVLVLLVSGLPLIIRTTTEEVLFQPERFVSHFVYLLEKLASGSLGTYFVGPTEREISQDIFSFAEESFLLLLSSLLIATIISILFGVFLYRFRWMRQVNRFFEILGTIPDFVLILIFLLGAITFYKWTDIRLITLSPFGNQSNKWFPVFVLSIGPTLYLLKVVNQTYFKICGEDYIRTAVAKGLNIWHILFHHVFTNVKPFLLSDLKKVIAITLSNLFIVEYLLNVPGITRFIFGQYQFVTVSIGLFVLLLEAFAVYLIIWCLLYLFERGFSYD